MERYLSVVFTDISIIVNTECRFCGEYERIVKVVKELYR